MSQERKPIRRKVRGYYLQRELHEAPRPEELALRDYSIVSPLSGAPGQPLAIPPSWIPFPSLGEEALYIAPSSDERALPSRFVQPLICRKRGRSEQDVGYVGLDSRILLNERLPREVAAVEARAPWHVGPREEPEAARPRYSLDVIMRAVGLPPEAATGCLQSVAPAVRVAIIDTGFGGWRALGSAVDEGTVAQEGARGPLHFPRSHEPPRPWQEHPGHGVRMARVIQALAPRCRLGLFETPLAQDSYAYATDLAAALARAVGGWRADVVLLAQADGRWGLPAHLRLILRNAARHGREGRGAVIISSVGRLDANQDVHDSAALAGDDLNAQPWVIPVAACSLEGHWYRVQGYPLSRLGPSVELCAPGDIVDLPGVGMADDASLAAALVAGTAVLMLERNPSLSLPALRGVLRLTAESGPVEEHPCAASTQATGLDEWDRSGHNFKLGHGRLDAHAAWLAAGDPVCHALLSSRHPGGDEGGPALETRMARAWEEWTRELASQTPLAREYQSVRGFIVPLVAQDSDLRDAVLWLARHLLALRRVQAPDWPVDGMDHGVLVDRGLHMVEVLSLTLETHPARPPWDALRRFCGNLTRALEDCAPQCLAEFLFKALGFAHAAE